MWRINLTNRTNNFTWDAFYILWTSLWKTFSICSMSKFIHYDLWFQLSTILLNVVIYSEVRRRHSTHLFLCRVSIAKQGGHLLSRWSKKRIMQNESSSLSLLHQIFFVTLQFRINNGKNHTRYANLRRPRHSPNVNLDQPLQLKVCP